MDYLLVCHKYTAQSHIILYLKQGHGESMISEWKKQIIYKLALILIATSVIVYILNIIVANQYLHEIRTKEINYELFREMNISNELFEQVFKQENKEKEELTLSTYKNEYDSYDVLTTYMLVYNFDTLKGKKIKKSNINLLLESLIYNLKFNELKKYYYMFLHDIESFPIMNHSEQNPIVSFENTWNAHRGYGGDRKHEGTDLMVSDNISGKYKVVSMTDGIVEKKGWLEQGGYRIGIRSKSGAYFYYAHLESYADKLEVGDFVKAGDFLGYVGDSGYGPEGTTGKFDVHLHLGIYIESEIDEISVNPYYLLRYINY